MVEQETCYKPSARCKQQNPAYEKFYKTNNPVFSIYKLQGEKKGDLVKGNLRDIINRMKTVF